MSANTYVQSADELNRQMHSQLMFMERSAAAFDQGEEDEAKRIALSLRIILHNTRNSRGLLKSLGLDGRIYFLSRSTLYLPSNLLSSWTLLSMMFDQQGITYLPILESKGRLFYFKFEDWWNEIIFDDGRDCFSRRDIVLTVANQDGGAHVDQHLDGKYVRLSRLNSLGWIDQNGKAPKNNPAYQAIRAIYGEFIDSYRLFQRGYGVRIAHSDRDFEMRFVDDRRRYKWSSTEINASEETLAIVEQHRKETRKLYKQEIQGGGAIELVG